MKKQSNLLKIILSIVILLTVILLVFVYILIKPIPDPTTKEITKTLNVKLDDSKKRVIHKLSKKYSLIKSDMYSCIYQCDKNMNFDNKQGWRPLPCSEVAKKRIEVYSLFNYEYSKVVLKIKNGYYFYQNMSKDPYNEEFPKSEYLSCYMAFYDKDTGQLYYTDATYL